MERASDKHSPKVDDALKNPRVSASTGYKHDAAPLDDDPMASTHAAVRRPGTPPGVGPDEIDLRSELATFVDRAVFPADRETLLDNATGHDAPSRVMAELQALPSGRRFATVQDVWEALGGGVEHRDRT